jgi:hypothetical protein
LKPGQKWSGAVTASWLADAGAIAAAEKAIAAIQGKRLPELSSQPRADWSK